MKGMRESLCLAAVLSGAVAAVPSTAGAASLGLWAGARGDFFSATNDLFTEFDNPFGGGFELGLEILDVTLYGERIVMGAGQSLYTLNLGVDFNVGKKEETRFTLGLFTGPVFFVFPEQDPATIDLSGLSQQEREELINATGTNNIGEVENQFDAHAQQQEAVGTLSFGWNLTRLRLAVDYPIMSILYIGLAGQVGYHLIISGKEAAAGARNRAVDSYAETHGITGNLREKIRTGAKAEPVDTENLNGFNYGANLYLRIEYCSRD